jgi:DNA-binding response OmpR family regulator
MCAADERIDLLITDLMLPRMSGDKLAARAFELRPALKVLFMSGRAADPDVEGGLPGGVDFLAKPFTLDDLAERVGVLLGGAAPAKPTR